MKITINNCIAQKRHRFARGFVYDPSSKDKKIAIQQIKEQFISNIFYPGGPFTSALRIKFVFHIKRPKAHFRTGKYSNELKKTAPVYHIKRPDVDNYVKFYLDVMQMDKTVYLDDSQVIEIYAKKEYDDKESYTEIII